MKRMLQSLAKSIARLCMRSDLLWELARRLPNHDLFYRQRYSLIRKRARRKCDTLLQRREILAGPFEGMKYAEEAAVGSSLWPKLLGTYESELRPCCDKISSSGDAYGRIIDVGYAEGYYLLGFGRIFQDAKLIGFDNDTEARRLCHANAEVNGIGSDRLRLLDAFDGDQLREELGQSDRTLVVVDCEGTENDVVGVLDREHLMAADWLIETHDHLVDGTTQRILKVFGDTHEVTQIETDDGLDAKLQLLPESVQEDCDPYVQEALVSEGRQAKQAWIFATRRAA